MTDENNSIQKPIKLFVKQTGVQAKLNQAKTIMDSIKPESLKHRLGLVFDDSSSMAGNRITQAKDAVKGFLKTCNPQETSIAVYPMNHSKQPLIANYFNVDMYVTTLRASGGTPMYGTLIDMLDAVNITRAIVFSDGEPTDGGGSVWEADETQPQPRRDDCIKKYKEKAIAIDTVFIGDESDTRAINKMKYLAKETDGIFLHFTDPSIFAKNLKYLAPSYRAMLADPTTKNKVEKGQI